MPYKECTSDKIGLRLDGHEIDSMSVYIGCMQIDFRGGDGRG